MSNTRTFGDGTGVSRAAAHGRRAAPSDRDVHRHGGLHRHGRELERGVRVRTDTADRRRAVSGHPGARRRGAGLRRGRHHGRVRRADCHGGCGAKSLPDSDRHSGPDEPARGRAQGELRRDAAIAHRHPHRSRRGRQDRRGQADVLQRTWRHGERGLASASRRGAWLGVHLQGDVRPGGRLRRRHLARRTEVQRQGRKPSRSTGSMRCAPA